MRNVLLVHHCFGLYDEARDIRTEFENEVVVSYIIVSSSSEVSLSLTAISAGNPVERRSNGLVRLVDCVIFVMWEDVDEVRDVEGAGEDGTERGVPMDFTRREGGVTLY